MQGFRILVAHATNDRLRQAERQHAHQQPLREIQRERHGAARKRLKQLGTIRLDGVHNILIAAARAENAAGKHGNAHQHGNTAQCVGHGNAAKTADRREDNHGRTK